MTTGAVLETTACGPPPAGSSVCSAEATGPELTKGSVV